MQAFMELYQDPGLRDSCCVCGLYFCFVPRFRARLSHRSPFNRQLVIGTLGLFLIGLLPLQHHLQSLDPHLTPFSQEP